MKNFDLNSMGVQEMNTMEMQETDGGILLALAACAVLLLLASSCQTQVTVQIGSDNSVRDNTQKADSTLNGNDGRLDLNQ